MSDIGADGPGGDVVTAAVDRLRPDVIDPADTAPADRTGWQLGWIFTAVLTMFYTWYALARHARLKTAGYDLGIFEQEVRSYAHLHWPTSSLKGPDFPLLGDHFSPAMAVLAPIYRIFPTPQTLLVAQAVLVALGAAPIVAWAQRAVGTGTAVVVGVGYGLSWGVADAIGFDVHEVMLAVPLIAFSAVALGEHRFTAAVWWAAPLVLVKEDLGLTVAAVGVLVALGGRVRLGVLTAVAGVCASAVEFLVLIPALSTSNKDDYTGYYSVSSVLHFFTPETKTITVLTVLAPTVFLAVRSRLVLLVVPTLVWRFSSNFLQYWGTAHHYNLVLMPIVFAAMVDALQRVPRRWPWLVGCLAVTAALLPYHAFAQVPTMLRANPTAAAERRLLDRLPPGVSVAASNWLAPQLTARDDVSLFGLTPLDVSRPDYIVVDTAPTKTFLMTDEDTRTELADAKAAGYRQIGSAGSVVLLRRGERRAGR